MDKFRTRLLASIFLSALLGAWPAIASEADSWLLVANDQSDPDNDGFGTPCDADFNNDCSVNFRDLSEFANAFSGSDPEFDLNGDTAINFLDLAEFANLFSVPPGPSDVSRICQ